MVLNILVIEMQFWIIYGGWGVVPVQSLSDELLEKKKKNNVHV